MQQAAQPQPPPNGQSSCQPQLVPDLPDKAGTLYPQPQHELPASRETLLPQPDKDKTVPRCIPRLRAVVESQAFKNVLVDEMDMMLSRAATLIQANWRGYRLRQKLVSQMTAAKAIQEAWRRFSTRRLLRSGKAVERKVNVEEGDIPYHPPQQVRFQHPKEGRSLLTQPVMVSRETQFPSSDSLAACAPQLALSQPQGAPQPSTQAPCAVGGPGVTFLPHQTITIRLPCPVSLDAKRQPCLVTRAARSACLVHHVEGDVMKTKQVTSRASKAGASGPPPSGRYAQAVHGPLKTQTQTHVETEVLKAPPQAGPPPVITKTPPLTSPAATMTKTPPLTYPAATMTKTPPQTYPAATMTKTPPQTYPVAMMTKTPPQPCPVPTVTITKTPPQMYLAAPGIKTPAQASLAAPMTKTPPQTSPAATMTKTPLHSCLAAMINKTLLQMYPAAMMTKIPPQPCPAAPMTKTPVQMRPTASMTNTSPQTRLVAMMTKTQPQMCPMASMIKPPTQTRPAAMMTKTPPQMCPMATVTKTPLQMCPAMAKTPSQTHPGASVTKIPPQTRLTAMITKTPAQLRSVAAILRTLCLPPPAASNLKAPPPTAVTAAIPNTSSHTSLNGPKAKAVVDARQAAGMVKVSSHSYLTEGKVKYFPPPHLGAGAPEASAGPPLEGELIKPFPQRQAKMETVSNTCVTVEMPRASSWAKVAEDGSTAHLRMDVRKVQSQVYGPVETAVDLPPPQLGTRPAKALAQPQLATRSTTTSCQAYLPAKLTKTQSLAHLDAHLTKAQSQAHLAAGAIKVQSQVHLPAALTKAQSQAQLVSETAKCLYTAHQAAELSSKTQSQPFLAGFKASSQPCQHVGTLGTRLRAKREDRLAQFPPHSYAQGKATQGPHQGASETQSLPVPLLVSAGHSTCNVESWGDSGAAWAQPSTASPAVPCQEELAAAQLASLCAELVALLGSREDLRALLAKALSQGEARAALNQALSSEVLGTTMAKALSPGMLGTALVKVLSWGKLDIALSRTLSWGELQAKLTKATQGKLADALSKALTEEEQATLSQALCQGELGAVLSQSVSQAALRTGVILPKATTKTARSGLAVMPTPVEVDQMGSPAAACGPTLGPRRPQPNKGPTDAGVAGGQAWNSAVPTVAVGPTKSTTAPGGAWELARAAVPWDATGGRVAADPRRSGELVVSMQDVEKIIIQAVVTIQACVRGYLVRRTVKVWHQWAIIIQAAWRGYRVRRELARISRAATVIQAMWRGFCTRRSRAQPTLQPGTWAEMGSGARTMSDHRCFQSCQPHVCALCQSLSPGLGSPPSVVMLVGSSPRTCHMCGQTLPTRVVHGTGQGSSGQAGVPWGCGAQLTSQSLQRSHLQNKAATTIQSAWRGFLIRRRLRQQQGAAKMLQATWRGHHARSYLTTDALLGPAAWDDPQHMQWPGV
ncbi:PREDICTED: uncharacterized protein KIAA1683 homolog [Ceratotherium simum simum]|uniref:Uncharacterized protein KIAA1683 homolog n=1 Tax=Ceratotherium simum simum TaxID=73337 RepID=A0ABM1CCD4_CERSS|nr:PREDICTED: uncharacterized protein KIAA1683 homolog [Ceratotherium simum simum]